MAMSTSRARAENIHDTHQRMGHHGMLLFAVGTEVYASHLPLYYSPHDYQLIFHIKSDNQSRLLALLENEMVTILPAEFDLNRLINGESFSLTTKVYSGHFERGGKLAFEDKSFLFSKQLFKRKLSKVPKILHREQKSFYLLDLGIPKTKLAIHLIQAAPSFDLMALVKNNVCEKAEMSKPNTFTITLPEDITLNKQAILNLLQTCTEAKILYFETQDFAG
jgi:hypothetical protein